MRILRNFAQGTDDWFQEHLGRLTASNAAAILDFTQKGVEGYKRRLYRLTKVVELLSMIGGAPNYVSAYMLGGTAAEPLARTAYELEENVMVEQVGFIVGDDERTGWSPDGLVGDVGAIEIKGPKTTTHLATLDLGVIPEDNLPQLWFDFMVSKNLEWIDFISRDGGMCEDKRIIAEAMGAGTDLRILPLRYAQFTIRLDRSECLPQIVKMREATDRMLADIDAMVERINATCPPIAQQNAPTDAVDAALAQDFADDIAWAQQNL
jgi:exodeoxyribonuclease (lambda-induced)